MALCCQAVNAEETQLDTLEVHSQNEIPFDAQTISLSEHDYAFGDLNSVLGRVPGFQMQSSGGFGAYSSFTLRGSTARSVPVYFDGVKVNDPLNGGINLSTFPLWSLESVNVYKSMIPAHLANNSGTAVMNLKSQAIQDKQDFKISGGSFDYKNIAANVANSSTLISAEKLDSENNFEYKHNNQTPLNENDDYSTTRSNNQVSRSFVLFKSRRRITDAQLNFMTIHRNYKSGVSNNLNHAKNASIQQRSTILSVQAIGNRWQLYLNGDFANHNYDDSQNEIGLSKDSQKVKYNKYEFKAVNLETFNDLHSTLSIQASRENSNIEDVLYETTSNKSIEANYLSFAHSLKIGETLKLSNSWLKRSSNDSYQTNNSSIGYYFKESDWLKSDISLSKKSRLPTISELYVNQGTLSANPDLKPEKFYEVNARAKVSYPHSGAQIDFYLRDSNDTIIYTFDTRGVGSPSNEGRSKLVGVETQAYWHIGQVELNWNIELTDSKNESNFKSSNGKQLPSFFHTSQYASMAYWFNKFSLGVANLRRYNMYYDTANLAKAPNQNIWSFTANYHNYPWKMGMHINNIFNKYYTGFQTEPLPGRSIIFTFSITN